MFRWFSAFNKGNTPPERNTLKQNDINFGRALKGERAKTGAGQRETLFYNGAKSRRAYGHKFGGFEW